MTSEIIILAPGICGPVADIKPLASSKDFSRWLRILSRAKCSDSVPGFYETVSSVFNLAVSTDFPAAALTMLTQKAHDPSKHYMFADPVYLQADMDHAILSSAQDIGIAEHESDALCQTLNQHFQADGICFFRLDTQQWLVCSERPIELSTTSLSAAIGRNVNFILPTGKSAAYWKQVLTEAQMLMYTHSVNEHREAIGKPSINSLWFYGSGLLPERANCHVSSICSNQSMFQGLASHVECDYMSLPSTAEDYLATITGTNIKSDRIDDRKDDRSNDKKVHVLHLSALEHLVNYTDVSIWLEGLIELLELWIYPMISELHKKNIKLSLYPCNSKCYCFTKYDRLKFWRSDKMESHVSAY